MGVEREKKYKGSAYMEVEDASFCIPGLTRPCGILERQL